MKVKMAKIVAAMALLLTGLSSVGCPIFLSDEPKALSNMID